MVADIVADMVADMEVEVEVADKKKNKLAKLRRCASQVSFGMKKFGLN